MARLALATVLAATWIACSDSAAPDLCPDDPLKTEAGACGCGVSDADTNANGVPDCFDAAIDLCPSDPAKTQAGTCGCGISDDDTDGNGVPDCLDAAIDLCPDDEGKVVPGTCGCGTSDADANGNGAPDCLDAGIDLCPDDAAKTQAGACGCSVADADANANGVPDCLDAGIDLCPTDPAKTQPGTCGCGVTDTDANANGVPDCLDAGVDLCPDDPAKTQAGACGCGESDADSNANSIPDCFDTRLEVAYISDLTLGTSTVQIGSLLTVINMSLHDASLAGAQIQDVTITPPGTVVAPVLTSVSGTLPVGLRTGELSSGAMTVLTNALLIPEPAAPDPSIASLRLGLSFSTVVPGNYLLKFTLNIGGRRAPVSMNLHIANSASLVLQFGRRAMSTAAP